LPPSILPYGAWPSPITPELITASQIGLSGAAIAADAVYWCESRPLEGGRVTLVRRAGDGPEEELTPAPFNLRSRVHEYGGRAWGMAPGIVVGVRLEDQRVHRLAAGAEPVPLTPPSDGLLRYAELVPDPARNRLLAVREDHRGGGQPVNAIVAIPLGGAPHEGEVICAGHDFFAYPRPSPDGDRLAWLAWDHPDMPWDGTRLYEARLDAAGRPLEPRLVAGGRDEAVVQPEWSPDGLLYFVSDRDEWWNLHRLGAGGVEPVAIMEAELAGPLWQLGARWYAFLDPLTIIAAYVQNGLWQLARLGVDDGLVTPLGLPFVDLGSVTAAGGSVVAVAAAADAPTAVIRIEPPSHGVTIVKSAGAVPVAAAWIAPAQPIHFPSADGRTAHAFYYAPTSPDHAAPEGELPPLIVRSHGGPTSAASPALNLGIQFWTSRGFAVVDVDYGGSTGYGRSYRRLLDGAWGVVDVEDCVAAARFLVAAGKADPERLAIRGGSAGGYTTLAALVFTDTFKVGASAYGISDLEILAKDTHKFESRYLDRLVGPWPERADLYRARSPIHAADRLDCPVIFLQGLEDKVVPPNQALMMVEALRRKGLPVAYLPFEGEGHGFRRAESIVAALEGELAFFCRIFGIEPVDGLAPLAIANL
jgi:dipeptidyl aminopeptidase/acylaminoacyl peptidase